MKAKLHILGCGSALPSFQNFPTSQLLEMRDKQFLIDCGEGSQIRLRQMGLKTNRLGHIFISHLHGDHCFGLMGFVSSLGLMNRTADLHIHGPIGIEELFRPQLNFFCAELPFQIFFYEFDAYQHNLIFEDRSVEVYTIPLKHRVPCAGFLFSEKAGDRHIKRDMIEFYQIPTSHLHKIKAGEDFVNSEGELIRNELLTSSPNPTIKYAYCSDTAYSEKIIPLIKEVDLLYHEATFADAEIKRAKQTLHSTATQAGKIAASAGVKKMLIGHFSARYPNPQLLLDQAQKEFQNTVLASDMLSIEF